MHSKKQQLPVLIIRATSSTENLLSFLKLSKQKWELRKVLTHSIKKKKNFYLKGFLFKTLIYKTKLAQSSESREFCFILIILIVGLVAEGQLRHHRLLNKAFFQSMSPLLVRILFSLSSTQLFFLRYPHGRHARCILLKIF